MKATRQKVMSSLFAVSVLICHLQLSSALILADPKTAILSVPNVDLGNTAWADSVPKGAQPAPDAAPSIDISQPLYNNLYSPGTNLVITWLNTGAYFPSTPDQTTSEAADIRSRAAIVSMLKDSPVLLRSLRIVSTLLAGDENDPVSHSPSTSSSLSLSSSSSANDLRRQFQTGGSGFALQNMTQFFVNGGSAGTMTWPIPVDFSVEGEFVVEIQTWPMVTKSYSFWIMRDAATRSKYPQYTVPNLMAVENGLVDGTAEQGSMDYKLAARQATVLSIYLCFSAIILLLLGGLGFILHQRKKQHLAQQEHQQQQHRGAYHEHDGNDRQLSACTNLHMSTNTDKKSESGFASPLDSPISTSCLLRSNSSSSSSSSSNPTTAGGSVVMPPPTYASLSQQQ